MLSNALPALPAMEYDSLACASSLPISDDAWSAGRVGNVIRAHITTEAKRITVPAFLRYSHVLSHMCMRRLFNEGSL